jgi:hypothetical protein
MYLLQRTRRAAGVRVQEQRHSSRAVVSRRYTSTSRSMRRCACDPPPPSPQHLSRRRRAGPRATLPHACRALRASSRCRMITRRGSTCGAGCGGVERRWVAWGGVGRCRAAWSGVGRCGVAWGGVGHGSSSLYDDYGAARGNHGYALGRAVGWGHGAARGIPTPPVSLHRLGHAVGWRQSSDRSGTANRCEYALQAASAAAS